MLEETFLQECIHNALLNDVDALWLNAKTVFAVYSPAANEEQSTISHFLKGRVAFSPPCSEEDDAVTYALAYFLNHPQFGILISGLLEEEANDHVVIDFLEEDDNVAEKILLLLTFTSILLSVFARANITGPAFTKLSGSREAELKRVQEQRRLAGEQICSDSQVDPSDNERFKYEAVTDRLLCVQKVISFWEGCPLGNPDMHSRKVGTDYLRSDLKAKFMETLSVDGDVLAPTTRAAAYLKIALDVIAAVKRTLLLHSNYQHYPLFLLGFLWQEGYAATLWHRALESSVQRPTLLQKAVVMPLAILECAGLVSPISLFPNTIFNDGFLPPEDDVLRDLPAESDRSVAKVSQAEELVCNDVISQENSEEDPVAVLLSSKEWLGFGGRQSLNGGGAIGKLSAIDVAWRQNIPSKQLIADLLASLSLGSSAALLIADLSNRLTWFGYTNEAVRLIPLAATAAGFSFKFDSCLGKRRSEQAKPVQQLALRVKQSSDNNTDEKRGITINNHAFPPSNESSSFAVETLADTEKPDVSIETVGRMEGDVHVIGFKDVDVLNDLLEVPEYVRSDDRDEKEAIKIKEVEHPLSIIQVAVLLALAFTLQPVGTRCDELRQNQVRCIIERCLYPRSETRVLPYSLLSALLWLRCRGEALRPKARDRAILQFKALWQRVNLCASENATVRRGYLSVAPLVSVNEGANELAYVFRSSGQLMSAADVYKDCFMVEESAECLIAAGRRGMALALLEQELKEQAARGQQASITTPRILCCLGDIHNDPSYYERAWDASGCRYSRAMRSLGVCRMRQGDLRGAIPAFQKALSLNPMYHDVWFKLGTCQLRTQDLEAAAKSFSRGVALEPDMFEAWANLAAIHYNCDRLNEALICIREALKLSPENWKLWDNYVKITMGMNAPSPVIVGVKRLIELHRSVEISSAVIRYLTDTAINIISNAPPDSIEGTIVRAVVPSGLGTTPTKAHDETTANEIKNVLLQLRQEGCADAPLLHSCCAKVAEALNDFDTSYAERWSQVREILAKLPSQWISERDSELCRTILEAVEGLLLAYRKWLVEKAETSEITLQSRAVKEVLEVFAARLRQAGCDNRLREYRRGKSTWASCNGHMISVCVTLQLRCKNMARIADQTTTAIEETFLRLQARPGVIAVLLLTADGQLLKSSLPTGSSQTKKYVRLVLSLVRSTTQVLNEFDEDDGPGRNSNDADSHNRNQVRSAASTVNMLRVRSQNRNILVVPNQRFMLAVIMTDEGPLKKNEDDKNIGAQMLHAAVSIEPDFLRSSGGRPTTPQALSRSNTLIQRNSSAAIAAATST